MNALGAIGHVEAILDPQARVLRLHLPCEVVRADVKTGPALRIANETSDRHRALHHAWERFAFLHVFPIPWGGAANFLRLVHLGELGELLVRERLDTAAGFRVFRAALASFVAIGSEDPGVASRNLVALLVEKIDVIDLLKGPTGKTGLVLDQILQMGLGGDGVTAQDRLVPRPIRSGPHGMDT